jgi:hypothetical protein
VWNREERTAPYRDRLAGCVADLNFAFPEYFCLE